jgi:hypothetical protein
VSTRPGATNDDASAEESVPAVAAVSAAEPLGVADSPALTDGSSLPHPASVRKQNSRRLNVLAGINCAKGGLVAELNIPSQTETGSGSPNPGLGSLNVLNLDVFNLNVFGLDVFRMSFLGLRFFDDLEVPGAFQCREVDVGHAADGHKVQLQFSLHVHRSSPVFEVGFRQVGCFFIERETEFGTAPGFREEDVHVVAVDGRLELLDGLLGAQAGLDGV